MLSLHFCFVLSSNLKFLFVACFSGDLGKTESLQTIGTFSSEPADTLICPFSESPNCVHLFSTAQVDGISCVETKL